MATARESGRLKESGRVLDEAARRRRARKALEALELDNFHEDPHADLVMSKKVPKFQETLDNRGGRRKKARSAEYYKQRFRKTFPQLVEEDRNFNPNPPNYMSAQAAPSKYPERHFCAVCGFPSAYTCIPCGARMAGTCFVQPLDLVKNRMQMSGAGSGKKEYKTSFHAFSAILKNEGIFAMYNGISAGLLRQATYTTTRLGVFTWALESFTSKDGTPPNFATKAGLGMLAGVCGAFVGTPAEVALIRMTLDGRLPEAERRNYKNVFDALLRITKEEGVLGLWRGAIPTMGRAMVVNAAQLATYSQAKQLLLASGYFQDNVLCHFASSVISGFVTTCASLPVDIAKTRIQNMKKIEGGTPEYKGTLDVFTKVVRNEGVFALWKGFTPYFARLAPHTVLTFIFLEQLNAFYLRRIA